MSALLDEAIKAGRLSLQATKAFKAAAAFGVPEDAYDLYADLVVAAALQGALPIMAAAAKAEALREAADEFEDRCSMGSNVVQSILRVRADEIEEGLR